VIDAEDWCQDLFWAPEVIRNEADGKYYMYFSAMIPQNYGVEGFSNSSNNYDRLHIGIAVSDTPVGPFDVLYDIDTKTGKRIPTINFHIGCNTEYPWSVIDASPFFDDNGDFYLYFNKHTDDHYSFLNGVWGGKMNDMTHIDYSTVACLTMAGKTTASNVPGNLEEVSAGDAYESTEGGINEGPYMIKHNGKYYLTYSQFGFGSLGYSVLQAVSDSPLSGFKKVSMSSGNPVLDGSVCGFINGSGHHAFAKKGDQLYVIYHHHDSAYGWDDSYGRSIGSDMVNFVSNDDGLDVLTANGPSKSLQWLNEDISGYANLAKTASISCKGGTGSYYLTDGLVPFYSFVANRVFSTNQDKATITLSWAEPVSVKSIMIFNSLSVYEAFSSIEEIRFKLAGQEEWMSRAYDYAVIEDLKLMERYYDVDSEEYIACASAVAVFNDIMVTEIQITLNGADKFFAENKMGEKSSTISISEIVVLGGENR